jgi:hypothetical protein
VRVGKRPAEPATQQEADDVATHGRRADERDEREEVDLTAPGRDAADDGHLTGDHQPHERRRLQERKHGHQEVRPRPEGVGRVDQPGRRVHQPAEDGDRSSQRRHYDDGRDDDRPAPAASKM